METRGSKQSPIEMHRGLQKSHNEERTPCIIIKTSLTSTNYSVASSGTKICIILTITYKCKT